MKRFFAPAALAASSSVGHPASSSSGSAAQPVPATSNSDSAAQSLWNIEHLRDVERWLSAEHVISSSIDTRDIREAVAILSAKPKPRQEIVRPAQNKWKIVRKIAQEERPLADVITEFQDKVVEAARKLEQQLASSAAQPSNSAESSVAEDPFAVPRSNAEQLAAAVTDSAAQPAGNITFTMQNRRTKRSGQTDD